MAKLIHIQSSPRGNRSASHAVAAHFIESYRAAHLGDTVETLDLWQTDLSEINGTTLEAAASQSRPRKLMEYWACHRRHLDHRLSATLNDG